MSNHFMSKTGLLIIMVLLAGKLCAQNYFVFLSTEDRQPFYVRLDSTMFSSSPDGHLILAPLRDSTYRLTIGFPGEAASEQRYLIGMREKDQEFQLKKRGDAGWGLFDQQANAWLTPEAASGKAVKSRLPGIRKDDAFSRMMADVVGDTAVLYNTYAMEQALNDSSGVAQGGVSSVVVPHVDIHRGDSASHSDSPLVAPASMVPAITASHPDSAASAPSHSTDSTALQNRDVQTGAALYRPTVIARLSERQTARGLRQVYTDRPGGGAKADTIVVIIPPDTPMTTALQGTSSTHPDSLALVQAAAGRRPRIDSSSAPPSPVVRKPRPDSSTLARSPVVAPTHVDSPSPAQSSVVRKPGADSAFPAQSSVVHKPGADSASPAQSSVVHKPRPDSASATQSSSPQSSTTQSATTHQKDTTRLVEIHPIPAAANSIVENGRPHPADSGSKRPGKPETPFINSDCHIFATDYDVDKLRMKMLEAVKEEERIATARKAFKTKCYTTSQLRILSEVFGTDGGRFRFFEAAWPFAADAHFRELSTLLTDPAYTEKFKSLTGQ